MTHAEAMTIWRARDEYRVQAACKGLAVLFLVSELSMYVSRGSWYVGVLLVAVQLGLFWCLRWALRWARRGLWWCLDTTQVAVLHWWHERRR
jgi:hypothetical protein